MKILITGASGLVGSYIAKRFFALGEIHALKRPQSDDSLLQDKRVKWIEGDINDYQSLEAAFEGMDMIIHVAGLVSYLDKDKKALMDVNLIGTANVVNVMLQKNIKKLIHISSVAALGRTPEAFTVTESQKWTESPLNSPYAISKYLGELEVWRAAQEGLDVIVVYPSVVLGRITDDRTSTKIYDYVLKENSYYPAGIINYVDVRDVAEAVAQCYIKETWGMRYIINAGSIPYKQFFEKLGKAFGKKPPTKPISNGMLKIVLAASWLGRLLGLSKIPISPQSAKLAQLKFSMSNERIKKELNFEFKTLEETISWAKENES
ncbi:nucleoside-diphosphate-sugar epimerase [Belliella baltica DSM 15883]|uniref:Nucleoside-diphosphate-sugar epimerase n=1 Tax=Belliella baltica (strain DSM 15883 / CIP 108006 / LMG 21964 / BA134) TaxID=866536 RepID=I3Z2T7_BELBD|nr:SDR family NAD(P)-dependent oxidoreductase [Belliella baltica]AFL83555.1 nucleoside-diphosphate-sugar epimerase [Belliella baltica DSM 15883]